MVNKIAVIVTKKIRLLVEFVTIVSKSIKIRILPYKLICVFTAFNN